MKNFAKTILAIAVTIAIADPVFARGFGGGFGGGGFHSFGGGGGFHSFGGGGGFHGFGGGGDHFGGFGGGGDHFGGFGGGGDHFGGFGGGGDHFGGGGFGHDRPGVDSGFGNHGGMGFRPNTGQRPADAGHFPSDGGFGHMSGFQNRSPHNISNTDLSHQGDSVRNSFNNDHVNVNNFNHYGNNYGHGAYGGYGNGFAHGWHDSNYYHGYGGYGWHGYGYGGWGYPGGFWGWPGGWWCPGWSEGAAWTFLGVSELTNFLGLSMIAGSGGGGGHSKSQPQNVTYNNNTVYVNGQPEGTSQQYYQQAQQLAAEGLQAQQNNNLQQYASASAYPEAGMPQQANYESQPDQSGQWQALGVFALAEPGQTQSNMLVQLAINKQGLIRGNYINQLTNEKSQLYGALDKNTQRVSWTIGQNNTTVFDTSLAGLTKKDSQVLVHYGPDSTSTMALIRLNQPSGMSPGGDAGATPNPGGTPPVAPNYAPG